MPFHATIIYKDEPGIRFDFNYYLTAHIPLATALFQKHGLKSWNLVKYEPGTDGEKPFILSLNLVWDNADQFTAALTSPDAAPAFADVANFTNGSPTLAAGSVVASS